MASNVVQLLPRDTRETVDRLEEIAEDLIDARRLETDAIGALDRARAALLDGTVRKGAVARLVAAVVRTDRAMRRRDHAELDFDLLYHSLPHPAGDVIGERARYALYDEWRDLCAKDRRRMPGPLRKRDAT